MIDKLAYKFYYNFYRLCTKIGLIQMWTHTETHDDMIIYVVEPMWFWKKGDITHE